MDMVVADRVVGAHGLSTVGVGGLRLGPEIFDGMRRLCRCDSYRDQLSLRPPGEASDPHQG